MNAGITTRSKIQWRGTGAAGFVEKILSDEKLMVKMAKW